MHISRFTSAAIVAVLATVLIPIGAPPAAAVGNPSINGFQVGASDGHGWKTYPTASCGQTHGFAVQGADPAGTILNPTGDVSIPLVYGNASYTLLGTGAAAPGSTATLAVSLSNGFPGPTVLEVGQAPIAWTSPTVATASATLAGKVVTVGNFRMHATAGPAALDRVGPCAASSDGVDDSYATFDVSIRSAAAVPWINGLDVLASDGGGWLGYPISDGCGAFHAFTMAVGDLNGPITNPAGDIAVPLADGASRYAVIGTDGNTPGATQNLRLTIGTDVVTIGKIGSFTSPTMATATVMGRTVKVSNFHFDAPLVGPSIDRVGTCSVGADGYPDSYGMFDVLVTEDAPTIDGLRVEANSGGGWWGYPFSEGCGVFHAFTIGGTDPNGTITNPAGGISIPLANGAAAYTAIGTDGNLPGATHTLQLNVAGAVVHLGEGPSFTPPVMATATVMAGGKRIDIGSFHFDSSTTRPNVDRVGTCSVGADGYRDSYGAFNVVVTPFPAPPPPLYPLRVQASDGGGWWGYPTATCGPFHAFVIAGTNPNGSILNPAGDVWLPLADGASDYTVIGTDANTPGATQQLEVSVDGFPVIVGEGPLFTPPVMATATVMSRGKRIDIGSFRFDASATRPVIDRVGTCSVGADGYNDSYGSFRVIVSPG